MIEQIIFTMKETIGQLVSAMKETAAEIEKIDPELGGYAWRKIKHLGANPTLKSVLVSASDITLLAEKAGLKGAKK